MASHGERSDGTYGSREIREFLVVLNYCQLLNNCIASDSNDYVIHTLYIT